ncbi:MAG: hypothetical protein ABS948_12065 [Solibacillus sp.]
MNIKSYQDKVSADHNIAANDFHYYYFLYIILDMKINDTVGLEVKDDIHIDLPNNKQVLIQIKHSIKKNKKSQPISLTELDSDLWKTLHNWKKMINDSTQHRNTLNSQIEYIKNTTFILISNKSFSSANKLLKIIDEFKNKRADLSILIEYLIQLKEKTQDSTIKSYIDFLIGSPKRWLNEFFKNIEFKLNEEDIIEKIKTKIKEKMIPDNRIDQVFSRVDSNIRMQNFFNVQNREKILITFDQVTKLVRPHFEEAQHSSLIVKKREENFSGNPVEQLFIKQLIDIEIIECTELEDIIYLTNKKLLAYGNLKEWEQEGIITSLQKSEFDNQCITLWQTEFDSHYRKIFRKIKKNNGEIIVDELIETAQTLYDDLLKYDLEFNKTKLGLEMSHGQFYLLADKPYIGWKLNWENDHGI